MEFREAIQGLLAQRSERRFQNELLTWSQRIDGSAVNATRFLSGKLTFRASQCQSRRNDLLSYFGSGHEAHPFCLIGGWWIDLHEPQITTSLAYFLQRGGTKVALAFMNALVPDRKWPDGLTNVVALSEAQTRNGRIDLLIKGQSNGQPVGVVIEAKYGHHAKANPFAEYRRFSVEKHFGRNSEAAEFIIVGRKLCKESRLLVENPKEKWKFVFWSDLLRRFEFELLSLRKRNQYQHPQDYNFSQLRRIMWEMA